MGKMSHFAMKLKQRRDDDLRLMGTITSDYVKQYNVDCMLLALRDAECMGGKKNVFGPAAVRRFLEGYERIYMQCISATQKENPTADVTQEHMDQALKEAVGEAYFVPWKERYPFVKPESYEPGQKWRKP